MWFSIVKDFHDEKLLERNESIKIVFLSHWSQSFILWMCSSYKYIIPIYFLHLIKSDILHNSTCYYIVKSNKSIFMTDDVIKDRSLVLQKGIFLKKKEKD